MKKIVLFLAITCLISPSIAQDIPPSFDPAFKVYEDSLKKLSNQIIHDRDEVVRRNSTFLFIKTLVSALKLPNSFEYPFDSVTSISILRSQDKIFRIFTWHLRTDDGLYRYYGAIQKNNKEKLELYALFDNGAFIPNPEDTIVDKNGWFGAHYYSIVETKKSPKNKSYVLLGWKGNDPKITMKVIDVLTFDEQGAPQFGQPIFKVGKTTKTRVIFQHSSNVSMILRYLPNKKWIVFDHLAAPGANQIGQWEFYGPDLSYDGFAFKKKKWVLMENIELRNEKSDLDKDFIDPRE